MQSVLPLGCTSFLLNVVIFLSPFSSHIRCTCKSFISLTFSQCKSLLPFFSSQSNPWLLGLAVGKEGELTGSTCIQVTQITPIKTCSLTGACERYIQGNSQTLGDPFMCTPSIWYMPTWNWLSWVGTQSQGKER